MQSRVERRGHGLPHTQCGNSWVAVAIAVGYALAIVAAPPARAQEPLPDSDDEASPGFDREPPSRPGIEEFLVRGGESDAARDFSVADSVTGFGAEDLAALGAQNIADIAAFTPNLEIVSYGATSPTFFIRGVGLNDFNSNSTGAVAIYQDDVVRNAPALQLDTLFDIEAVNVLRGPQGTGLARNASAGAIKIYSRKPTGEFGGFLRSDLGDFGFRDYEGAVETPLFEDILSARFAFRLTERDGTMKNRCGGAKPYSERAAVPSNAVLQRSGLLNTDRPWSVCGEPVRLNVNENLANPGGGIPQYMSGQVPPGLPDHVNDTNNWAARGTFLFQPTLDASFLVNAHGSRRDELTRLGQSIGTFGNTCANGDVSNCIENRPGTAFIGGTLGGTQGVLTSPGYRAPEIRQRLRELAPNCYPAVPGNISVPGSPEGSRCVPQAFRGQELDTAKVILAKELTDLDSKPWVGDFNICGAKSDTDPSFDENGVFIGGAPGTQCKKNAGKTINDTWGGYLKGDIALPLGMQLATISGYDTYDRFLDIDLDFSPETLFQIETDDEGWQFTQDIKLDGQFREGRARWEVGGWFLRENLDVEVTNDLGPGVAGTFGVGKRVYTQDVYSAAGYLSLAFDFWDDFTLDGGIRYNWEQKKLDYELFSGTQCGPDGICPELLNDIWQDPTGTIRLTYRFREDTHAFWKYTRGFKPGTYNATSSPGQGVSVARPETIDSFETGVSGSWLDGRLSVDFSVFYYSYSDYQLFTAQQFVGGQPEFVIINADAAEVYGAELDAVIRPWYGAFANLRVGWIESEFLDFVQIQQDTTVISGAKVVVNRELQNTGNSLLNSPRFKISMTGEQTLPLWSYGSLTLRYDGVWTDETFFDATEGRGIPNNQNIEFLPDHTTSQTPFWLHNLRLSYRAPGGRFEVAGWVRNLTNEAYKTFAFDGSTFTNTSIYFVGDPRTVGGSVIFNF